MRGVRGLESVPEPRPRAPVGPEFPPSSVPRTGFWDRFSVGIVLVLLACGAVPCSAKQYVVDQKHAAASDSNPGTAEAPLKTVKRSLELVQAGDKVRIRPGDYVEESLILRTSGTKSQPIVFEADVPGTAIIAGGPRLSKFTRSEFPLLMGPPGRDPQNAEHFMGADYITLRGLVFRDSLGSTLGAATGWRIEDCVVERSNFDGISVHGDDIVILRTVVQDACLNGMSGGYGEGIVVKDCILRRCNRRGESPGGYVGACKFLATQGMRVENVISYDHFGTGWWWDWDNRNYAFTGCTVFGIHAGAAIEDKHILQQAWAAAGLWSEGNQGPGVVSNNCFYSITGPAFGAFESPGVVFENNLIVDCSAAVEFRDLPRDDGKEENERVRRVANIVVKNNRIKGAHWAAFATSIGEFKRGDKPADYKVSLDGDTFDPSNEKPVILWKTTAAKTLEDAQRVFGIEAAGKVGKVRLDAPLIPVHSTSEKELNSEDPNRFVQVPSQEAERLSIDRVLEGRKPGQVVAIPVFGRTDVAAAGRGFACEVYDLHHHRHVRVLLPDASKRTLLEDRVTRYAVLRPVYLRVKITRLAPYSVEAELVDVQ